MRAPKLDAIRPQQLRRRTRKGMIRLAELQKQMQQNLFQFLMTDLQLAEKFCDLAERSDNKDRKRRLLRSVQEAVDTVLRFHWRLVDENVRRAVQAQADQLSARLGATNKPSARD